MPGRVCPPSNDIYMYISMFSVFFKVIYQLEAKRSIGQQFLELNQVGYLGSGFAHLSPDKSRSGVRSTPNHSHHFHEKVEITVPLIFINYISLMATYPYVSQSIP